MGTRWSSHSSFSLSRLSSCAPWSSGLPRIGSQWAPTVAPWDCSRDVPHHQPSWEAAYCSYNGKSIYTLLSCVQHCVHGLCFGTLQHSISAGCPSPNSLTSLHHPNLQYRRRKPLHFFFLWIRSHQTRNMCWRVSFVFTSSSSYGTLFCYVRS